MINDEYLTTGDAVAYLQTAPRTLYRLLAKGKIPAVRIGHQWRFRKSDLDRWVAAQSPHRPKRDAATAFDTSVDAHRVLVVDDDPAVRHMLARILAFTRCEIEMAPDGAAGLDVLQSKAFDLVITDLKMSVVEGIEVGRVAKQRWPGIKVIILTGYPSQSSAIEAVNLGFDGYLMKPIAPTDVLTA